MTVVISIQHAPVESPEPIAVRELLCEPGRKPVEKTRTTFAPTLESARRLVPDGKTWNDRDPDDDPAIIETWR